MRPLQIRYMELDAHPTSRPDAVHAAALETALKYHCDVRVFSRDSRSFCITYLSALEAATALVEISVDREQQSARSSPIPGDH